MLGQGRPHRRLDVLRTCIGPMLLAACLIMPTGLAVRASSAQEAQAPPTLRLRITFGGGSARMWRGTVSLSDGSFAEPQLLGLKPDEPGSMTVGVKRIQIRQPSPRGYDGLDVSLRAPLDARLKVRLDAVDDPTVGREFQFTLSDLVTGAHPVGEAAAGRLDETGNRLVVTRAPGDVLRVTHNGGALILEPKSVLQFSVVPHLTGVAAGTDVRLRLRIVSRLTGVEHMSTVRDVRTGEGGAIEPWGPHEFTLPEGDGVFNLDISLEKPGFFDPLVAANPLSTIKPVAQRTVQFVALSDQSLTPQTPPREILVDEFDPVTTTWAERAARWPLLKRLPRMRQGRLFAGKVRVAQHLRRSWVELSPEAWQAHALSIDAPGQPYVLEVEFPDHVPQTLGVSIVQPNAVGKVAPLGVDSAVSVAEPAAGTTPAVGKHRLIFWPRTKTPIVLLTSHDADRPAIYGRVRIYRFSGRLAPRRPRKADAQERLVAAWLDKPLLAEMFSATEAADGLTGRSLDDWRTMYEGAERFTQYLHHAGYNSAVVPALCEGSALYPSQLLQPTPKYDTGIYLTNGQDPARKDVLELLFRLFDREGLTLVPSLQFDTPLPVLEKLQSTDVKASVGLQLVDHQGRTWPQRFQAMSGLAPHYNPLDERVQAAMNQVLRELVQRYAHHPSFGGVVVQLSADGYTVLPGGAWGLDDRTFSRFARDAQVEDPGVGARRFQQRARWCAGEGEEKWLTWRSAQIAKLYQAMAAEVGRGGGRARLILAGPEMLDNEAVRAALRPSLSAKPQAEAQIRRALLSIGLDPQRLREIKGVQLTTPHTAIPARPGVPGSRWDAVMVDELHRQLAGEGSLLYREPLTRRLASFDAASPFGRENTFTWLAAQAIPAGDASRRRWTQALTRGDQTIFLDGGWMLPRGQEDPQVDLLTALRHLPTESLQANSSSRDGPLVIRALAKGNTQTLAYVLNPTPWSIQAQLNVKADVPARVTALVPGKVVPDVDEKSSWTIEVAPYDLIAVVFNRPQVKLHVESVKLPTGIEAQLEKRLADLRGRALSLKTPQGALALTNPGFEDIAADSGDTADWLAPGWVAAQGAGIDIALADGGHRKSARALRVKSEGQQAWVRSRPIKPPSTGRVAVWARLRTSDAKRQPELRLAIEARHNGQPYYRFAKVGAGEGAAPLSNGWSPFVLHIDDLPREGLSEFRIGFDLMGAGEVWVDDIKVYQLSFTEREQFLFARLISESHYEIREKNYAAAGKLLTGYWPRFLLQHVETPKPAIEEAPRPVPAPVTPPPNLDPAARQTWREWLRKRWW